MSIKKRSFFERLTGGIRLEEEQEVTQPERVLSPQSEKEWVEEEPEEGQLMVDVYQTPTEIIIQSMVAGVRPEDLSISISRDMVTIKGRREENKTITRDNYFVKELYWGTFSRTISLPQEIEPGLAEAMEKYGLLIVKLPKIDKAKQTMIKVKSV